MNRLLLDISKILALLAVTLLPVRQTLAATCCCRGVRIDGKHVAAGEQRSCCLQSLASCCSTARTQDGTCCEHGRPASKPCRCPAGCCGKDAPKATEPATDTASSGEHLALATVPTTVLDAVGETPSDSLGNTTSRTSTSGSERCVLLCRYRL